MAAQELHETARAIVADHKGILAADESTGTIKKRFDSFGVESTDENRRFYRGLLFTATGIEDSIGGVIFYDETLRQRAGDGTPFPELLASKGVVPGIKVDTGAHDMAGFPGEKVTLTFRLPRDSACSWITPWPLRDRRACECPSGAPSKWY